MTFQLWLQRQLLRGLKPGDKYYPHYNIDVVWVEDIVEGMDFHESRTIGLPKGKVRNNTAWTTMFQTVRDLEDIEDELLRDWWQNYAQTRKGAENPIIVAKFTGWEVWCESWFSHWTFDVGMTNEQVLQSFSRYVNRIELANEHFRYCEDQSLIHGRDSYFCLMGAEDRWRWYGTENGDPKERTDPPCRCEHCRKAGIVRIGH